MGKRIKRVFSNSDQVLHLWANQSQSDARAHNVFFEGVSCYSYGRHYELGRIVDYKGIKVAMINDRGYSVTTSKHIRQAMSAASHMPMVCSHDLGAEYIGQALLKKQDELIAELFEVLNRRSFWKGATYGFNSEDYETLNINEFNATCLKLGFDKLTIDVSDEFWSLLNSHVQLKLKRQAELNSPEELAKKDALREKRAEKQLQKARVDLQAWTLGGPLVESIRQLPIQAIRIVGDRVETSKGAQVMLRDANILLSRVISGKAKPGEGIGSFTLNRVDGDRVIIGCHILSLSQCSEVLTKSRHLSVVS